MQTLITTNKKIVALFVIACVVLGVVTPAIAQSPDQTITIQAQDNPIAKINMGQTQQAPTPLTGGGQVQVSTYPDQGDTLETDPVAPGSAVVVTTTTSAGRANWNPCTAQAPVQLPASLSQAPSESAFDCESFRVDLGYTPPTLPGTAATARTDKKFVGEAWGDFRLQVQCTDRTFKTDRQNIQVSRTSLHGRSIDRIASDFSVYADLKAFDVWRSEVLPERVARLTVPKLQPGGEWEGCNVSLVEERVYLPYWFNLMGTQWSWECTTNCGTWATQRVQRMNQGTTQGTTVVAPQNQPAVTQTGQTSDTLENGATPTSTTSTPSTSSNGKIVIIPTPGPTPDPDPETSVAQPQTQTNKLQLVEQPTRPKIITQGGVAIIRVNSYISKPKPQTQVAQPAVATQSTTQSVTRPAVTTTQPATQSVTRPAVTTTQPAEPAATRTQQVQVQPQTTPGIVVTTTPTRTVTRIVTTVERTTTTVVTTRTDTSEERRTTATITESPKKQTRITIRKGNGRIIITSGK